MSALLSATMPEMERVTEGLKHSNLRSITKVIVGGAAVTPEFGKKIDADATCRDAIEGVKICKGWTGVL